MAHISYIISIKLEIFNSFNDEHPSNISLISVILFLKNFLKNIELIQKQYLNNPLNDLI